MKSRDSCLVDCKARRGLSREVGVYALVHENFTTTQQRRNRQKTRVAVIDDMHIQLQAPENNTNKVKIHHVEVIASD